MSERVVEILIYIMSEMRRNDSVSGKLDILSQDLLDRGYTESEISSAFTWLLDKIDGETEEVLQRQRSTSQFSFRHLHEIERAIITPEAYGFIIQLKELAIIDDFDFEQILERALMLGVSRVDLAEMKSLASSILAGSEMFIHGVQYFLDDQQTVQ